MPLASFLFSSSYSLPTGFDLRQRGELVVVSGNVGIKDVAVDFRGFQRGVPQQLLERKGVSAAVHQILAGGGVGQKDVKGFFKGEFFCFGTCCGHLNSCHGSDLLSHPNSDKKTGGHSFLRKKKNP